MGGVELVVTLHGRGRACPARRFAWADVCGWLPGGWPLAQGFAGRRGRRPLRFAGNGRRRGPPPHPALRGHLPPRGKARAVVEGFIPPGVLAQASAGRRGRRPLRLAREWAAAGASPSSGPAGPPSPKGEGKGCCWRQREVAAGWRHPALRMGIWKRPRGLRGHPFPDRRTVGAGHARPGGGGVSTRQWFGP